jgi:hypothetical protein
MRALIFAAAAVVCAAFAVPSAQAHVANGGLNAAAPGLVEDAHYTGYPHSHARHHSRRYRHCWNQRVRVRTASGHVVYRTVRRCAYRYR